MAIGRAAKRFMGKGGRGMGRLAGSTAGLMAIGTATAMGRTDMGTFAMDTMDEMLTGRTDSDVTYTGAERSLMDPVMRAFAPISLPSPKYMNPVLNGYAKSMGEQIESDNFAFQRSRGYNAPMPTQGNFQRGADGSMVFGMWNLR